MTGAIGPKKPVSERRRQQNRQAQKNYRNRQVRRLRALESIIESREVSLSQDAIVRGSPSDSYSGFAAITPESMIAGEEPLRNPKALLDATDACESVAGSDDLSRLLDEKDRQILTSKGLTIQEVLKAGIEAVSQSSTSQEPPLPQARPSLQQHFDTQHPLLRTDQIYVLENAGREHEDYLPDIYRNHIRIKKICVVAAIKRNSEMIGANFEQVIDLDEDSVFYDPSHISAEGKNGVARFQHINHDLRPTPAQMKYNHSAWIDTMPSPTLRQRLIECISSEPPIVDEEEFCNDLDRDGLICWGSSGGKTESPSGSGAPWDIRSWEAQPWFLRKWWFLIGGTSGELYQASRWWTELRGDRLSYAWQ